MTQRRLMIGGNATGIVIAAIAVLAYLALAGVFAGIQNVWVDESTQLTGSSLPFGRMIAWLAGHPEPLGVPADRMPPVSYAIDALCGRTLCASVIAYRWLHMAVTAIGIGALVMMTARRYGALGAITTAAFLVLTPQMLQTGVEIRAYPLFFAATVLQILLLYRLIDCEPLATGRLIAFALAGILAIYTHFFGVVSTSALFVGLIVARARSGRELGKMVAAWAVVLAAAVGIEPFVMGASALSQSIENAGAPGPRAIVTFILRIIGHSSMMLHPMLVATFCLALGVLLLIAAGRATRGVASRPRAVAEPALAVLVALAAGLAVTILAAFVVHGFNPLKPSYSVWAVPLVALLAGAAFASGGRARIAAIAATGVMIAALAPMTYVFLTHAEWFVHGPEVEIAAEIGDRPDRTAIVYVDDGWGYAYFPLIYRYRGALAQYVLNADGTLYQIGKGGDTKGPPVQPAILDRMDRLLLVSVQTRSYRNLRARDQGYLDPVDTQPISADRLGTAASAWNSAEAIVRPGIYWLRLTRLQRTDLP